MTDENTPSKTRELLTVNQFASRHPAFTPGGLRHLIFYAEQNGFQRCIRRIGRKVLLDEAEVFRWIDDQNAVKAKCI